MSTTLLKYWFTHEHLWFNCTPKDDEEIYSLFNDYSPSTYFEYILYHDQIQRHISRHKKIEFVPKYVLDRVEKCLECLENYTPPEIVFILLPLRHTKDINNINRCLNIVNSLIEEQGEISYYLRFRKATFQDILKHTSLSQPQPVEYWEFSHLLDEFCTFNPLQKRSIPKKSDIPYFPHHNKKCIISVSGGVDSMLCLFFAKSAGLNPTALMINYNNRACSLGEVEFVSWFCHSLQIPFYVRHINEISRTRDSQREYYEEYTRNVRFHSYKTLTENNINVPVILGHNKDDVEENILRNIQKRRSLFNLKGMTADAIIKNVRICRPLLEFSKSQIYNLAQTYNIPFLHDSTPPWSERGIMRTEIISHIPRDILDGHIHLSEYVSELYSVVKMSADSVAISKTDYGWTFADPNTNSLPFWDILFKRILKTDFILSRKSLNNFIKISKKHERTPYKIQLLKNLQIRRDNKIVKIVIIPDEPV